MGKIGKIVQVLQNRALCSVYDIEYLTPRLCMYGQIIKDILPIKGLCHMGIVQFVYKRLHLNLGGTTVFSTASHHYNTRNRRDLITSQSVTNYGLSRPTVIGPILYNLLPVEVRQSHSYKHFKKKSRLFYGSVNELKIFLNY